MKRKNSKLISSLQVVLIIRLLIVLFIFSLSRIALFTFNTELFSSFSFWDILTAYFAGFRFDISILFIFSLVLIIGNTLPLPFRKNTSYQKNLNGFSIIAFSIVIFLNISDVVYYRFTLKRTTYDIVALMESNDGFIHLIPTFIIDFWQVSLAGILLIILLIYLYFKIGLDNKKENISWRFYLRNSLYFILWSAVVVLGIRGGTQLKPINMVDASLYVKPPLTPLVLNTPFTIIKSYGQEGLQELNYFNEEELEAIYNPIQSYGDTMEGVPKSIKNVVVIILESFSSEHIGYLTKKKTFTPFLDSLFEHSLVFSGTANGKRSIDGIPAILSALPTLSNEAFLNGPYAMNQIEGLASTLSENSYQTAFFHGGKNGTMSFYSYTISSGFEAYYGLDEYPNEDDYDGHWGVWDEEYLRYFAAMQNDFQEPFFTTLFTLSSHHPYSIPKKYKNKFPKGDLKIQETIAYTDMSLRKYFERVKKEEWYSNTLFVFTADHTSEGASPFYRNSLGQYSIPIAFFAPGDSLMPTRSNRNPVQQTDLFPSILDYIGINDTVLCFGNSVFSPLSHPIAVNYNNNILQLVDSTYLLQIDGEKVVGVYQYKKDSLLKKNLINKADISNLLELQKAFSQQYNNRMIQNRLKADSHE